MAQFAHLFGVTNTTTILDIGGSAYIWSFLDINPRVTCLNLEGNDHRPRREGNIELVSGDGRCLPYPDQSFDVAFSNSVIEHVGTKNDMHKLANEIRRVGKRYYVQTPNFWFPIDPHTYAVGNHWLPDRLQFWAIKYTSPRAWLAKWSDDVIREYISTTYMLSAQQLRNLFPDATIIRERVAGLTKSLIACRS
jgi:hypothetical protein